MHFLAEDLKFLSSIFHLCSPLQESDIVIFKSWLVNTWVNFAMMDYPYEANFLQPLPAWPIKVIDLTLIYEERFQYSIS